MKKIIFLTTHDARYGFNLAGVHQRTTDPAGAESSLAKIIEDAEPGLLAIDERLVKEIGEERFHEMERHWSGVIIVLPGPETGEAVEEDYAMNLISRAIGYQVRLSAS